MSEESRSKMVELIEDKFKSIKRKKGNPYTDHLYAVEANALKINKQRKFPIYTPYLSLVALGHDLIEDTDVTFECIEQNFNAGLAADILLLSRPKVMNYFNFIQRLVGSGRIIPIVVKLADLQDNMSDLEEGSLKDKYRFAEDMLNRATYNILLT